jgi:F-type H+-transporting ATPase subunit epsilon
VLKLKIIALSGVKYDGEVHDVLLPTIAGQIGVYQNHSNLITTAADGIILIRKLAADKDDYREAFACHGGLIEIMDGNIKVLSDEAVASHEVTEATEQQAYKDAKMLLANAIDQQSLDEAQKQLDRYAVRLKLATLKRKHKI